MKKIYEFNNEIYPRKLWVVYDSEETVMSSFVGTEDEEITQDAFSGAFATTLEVVKKGDLGWKGVVIDDDKNHLVEGGSQIVSTVTHESIHAANMIFRGIGVNYTKFDDEHFAYLAGWIARMSWKVLQNYLPK